MRSAISVSAAALNVCSRSISFGSSPNLGTPAPERVEECLAMGVDEVAVGFVHEVDVVGLQ